MPEFLGQVDGCPHSNQVEGGGGWAQTGALAPVLAQAVYWSMWSCVHAHTCVVGYLPSAASIHTGRVRQGFAQRGGTTVGKQLRRAGRQAVGYISEGPSEWGGGPVLRAVRIGTCQQLPEHATWVF